MSPAQSSAKSPPLVLTTKNRGSNTNINATHWLYIAAVCVAALRAVPWEREDVNAERRYSALADLDKRENASAAAQFTFGFPYTDECGRELRALEKTFMAILHTILTTHKLM